MSQRFLDLKCATVRGIMDRPCPIVDVIFSRALQCFVYFAQMMVSVLHLGGIASVGRYCFLGEIGHFFGVGYFYSEQKTAVLMGFFIKAVTLPGVIHCRYK